MHIPAIFSVFAALVLDWGGGTGNKPQMLFFI